MKKQILTLLLITLTSSLLATIYHVEISGSDALNNGSKEKPWASIAHAVAKLAAGDTVLVGVGSFTEHSLEIPKKITILGIG
ncbi:MAG: hypothetical protein GY790_23845, partial [Bacteroidetes bacterium]|nr:hypothetical protein [Bacteroidota bacterium]